MLAPSDMKTYGFMLTRQRPDVLDYDYWAIARVQKGWTTEFASAGSPACVMEEIQKDAALALPEAESVGFDDANHAMYRACWFDRRNNLLQVIFLAPYPVPLARHAIVSMLGHDFKTRNGRLAVVSGVGFSSSEDVGAMVCSCMQVGIKTIRKSIDSGCNTVQDVGDSCGAGTQCGTCRSDIRRMLSASLLNQSHPSSQHPIPAEKA